MTSKERLDKLLQYQSDIINSNNPKDIEIKSKIFDSWYNKVVEDLEVLDLFKKYFAGVLQEKESGRLFIDMNELEEGDLAVFLKLRKEKLFKE